MFFYFLKLSEKLLFFLSDLWQLLFGYARRLRTVCVPREGEEAGYKIIQLRKIFEFLIT